MTGRKRAGPLHSGRLASPFIVSSTLTHSSINGRRPHVASDELLRDESFKLTIRGVFLDVMAVTMTEIVLGERGYPDGFNDQILRFVSPDLSRLDTLERTW